MNVSLNQITPPPPLPTHALFFDPSVGLEFFNKLKPCNVKSSHAFGDANHKTLSDRTTGLFIWIWTDDVKKKLISHRSFFVCSASVHTLGHKSIKKQVRCCFKIDDVWVPTRIYLCEKVVNVCQGAYKARSEAKLANCMGKWAALAVFRSDGLDELTPEKPSVPKPLPAINFNLSLRPVGLPLFHESQFHVKEKCFGIDLHNLICSERLADGQDVIIYGWKETMQTKRNSNMVTSGFICSGILHKGSPATSCIFAIQNGHLWHKAYAFVTADNKLECCGNPLYKYEVN